MSFGSTMSDKTNSQEKAETSTGWIRPNDVMALHRLRQKKKALQARMNRTCVPNIVTNTVLNVSIDSAKSTKRRNPFVKNNENKRPKNDIPEISSELSESTDGTLFHLLHPETSAPKTASLIQDTSGPLSSFSSALNKLQNNSSSITFPVATPGEKWIPIDWTLKYKLRLMSPKPFAWNRTLKTSEEASGITGFVRCLDTRSETSLDTSPNAQFHQCCLYWQHPSLPWLNLFPRSHGRVSATVTNFTSAEVKESMQSTWSDSLRSLFQLLRARQCPYFYVCANSFTACFRAAGICGHSEMHVILTPTTRGFRHLLRQEDIAFTMPLKNKRRTSDGTLDLGYNTLDSSSQALNDESQAFCDDLPPDDDDCPDEEWLSSLGVNAEEIKKIHYQQAKINRKNECEVDNSEQSLIYVEGVEVHGFYDFLINCKSIVATTGPLAGVPPTLLAPVAFHGASLQSLKVKENRIRDNNAEFYSIELSGPILPHTLHNLYSLLPKDTNVTATFANVTSTAPFSKVKCSQPGEKSDGDANKNIAGSVIFGEKNLSECGLNKEVLKLFCSADPSHVQNYDSLKYISDTELYVWL